MPGLKDRGQTEGDQAHRYQSLSFGPGASGFTHQQHRVHHVHEAHEHVLEGQGKGEGLRGDFFKIVDQIGRLHF